MNGITTKKNFLLCLAGITSAVPYLHSLEHWHTSGFLDNSELKIGRPVLSPERKKRISFNQALMSKSFVYKKGTKDFSEECGIENKKSYSHIQILGGQKAEPNQWPWQVALFVGGSFHCAGSLISDEWVMTAKHCAKGVHEFRVIAGAHNIRQDYEPNRQEFISQEVIIYPGGHVYHMDIALIKLSEKIAFNEYMRPVCLPGRNEDVEAGDKVTVTGWGQTEMGYSSDVLLMIELTIISNNTPEVMEVYWLDVGEDVVCACSWPYRFLLWRLWWSPGKKGYWEDDIPRAKVDSAWDCVIWSLRRMWDWI